MKLFLLAALAGALSFAQVISGTIAGNVIDPSGGAVPNAKVTVTNTDKGQVIRTLTTDSGGNYVAALLPVGTYSIKVEASGFAVQARTGIAVNVNDDIKLNISLSVGTATTEVTVTDTVTNIELSTPANATTITGTQIRELALNTRNYAQLVNLMPGVSANQTDQMFIGNSLPSGLVAVTPFSVNGQRNSANNWTVDGADNVDRGGNLTLINYPSADAIDQFKVQRSLYTADSGRAGGGQINVVTKSGGQNFHGNLYEFLRNNYFVANNFINNANRVNVIDGKAQVPPLRWNDFGGTIGGPLYIPKLMKKSSKTFFFYSEEHRRIITYVTLNPTVPTTGMLQGQFTSPVCTAFNGTTCTQTGTSIANINPVAQSYIKSIFSKLPLSATSTQIFAPVRNQYNHNQELVRIDHQFSERFSVFFRFLNDDIPTVEPGGFGTGSAIPGGAVTNTNSPGRSFVVHVQNSFRSNLLNDAGYNFSRSAIHSTPVGLTSYAQSPDIKVNTPFPVTLGVVPILNFTGGSSVNGLGPYDEFNRDYNAFDNLTWIKGKHTVKAGVSVHRYNKTENAAGNGGNNYGTFSITSNGVPTGTSAYLQSWANFLLGNVGTFTQSSTDLIPNLKSWQTEAYVQDDFRYKKNLTVYVGVRYSLFGAPTDDNGLLTTFSPAAYKLANAPAINSTTGNIIPNTGNNPSLNGIIIGGKGSPYGDAVSNTNKANFAPRVGLAWDPFGKGQTSVRMGYGIYYDAPIFGMYEQNQFINPPFVQSINVSNTTLTNPGGGTVNVSQSPLVLRATPDNMLTAYTQHWSFDVQQVLPLGFSIDAGYFGSKGTHLLGIVDINQARPGVALAAGLKTGAGTIFTPTDTPRINAVRPYLGFNAINAVQPAFDSNYHSLQVSVRKDFKTGGVFNLSYTWSKNLTDNPSDRSNAPQNSYNWHDGEYGPASLDRRQVLTANYVYALPILPHSKGAVAHVAKGWQLSGITSFGTGLPSTVTTSNLDPAGLGFIGSSQASGRPDVVCDPNANAPHIAGLNGQWFNTACFQEVASGNVRPGNAGRGIVRGPGYAKWDISLFKNIKLTEKTKLQLRWETFNTFNHGNPSGFGSTNRTSSVFGLITSYRDPRLMQIAAKLSF